MKKGHNLATLIYLSLLTVLLASACASQPRSSAPASTQMVSITTPNPFAGDIDRQRFADWEKSHAVYVHDLEFAALEKDNSKNKESIANLIDARLYVSYAEADQLELGHPVQARKDLQKSRDFLSRAALKTDSANRVKIQSLAKELKLSTLFPKDACSEPTFSQARYRYQHLKANFDELISEL